jgi:hypothetical protein
MKKLRTLWVTGLLLCLAQTPGGKMAVVTFEKDAVDQLPPGFTTAVTGPGPEGTWVVRESDGRRVLAQTSADPTDGRFPHCVLDKAVAKDVMVEVKFKPVSGKVDQAAGIVVRYHDKDNYLLLRANALENNVRFYKVVNGQRYTLAGAEVPVASGRWQELRFIVKKNACGAALDGKDLFKYSGDFDTTAGKVGLWTKADSVAEFDRLAIYSAETQN